MSKAKYHVTHKNGEWKGTKVGSDRASTTGSTKDEVVRRTIQIAKRNGDSSVIIHKKNGVIQEERTYGSDPFPPKG